MERARHFLVAELEMDMESNDVSAASIQHTRSVETEVSQRLLDQVTKKTIKIPLELDENLLFDGREILAIC